MPLRHAELLRRLLAELENVSSYQLLGIDWPRIADAAGAQAVPAEAVSGSAPVELLVVAAAMVSETGDLVPTAEATERATELGTTVRELAAAAAQVLAILSTDEPSAARSGRKDGPALTERCTEAEALPGIAARILCPWAVLDVTAGGLVIRELAPNVCARSLQATVTVPLKIASDVVELSPAGRSPAPQVPSPAADEP